MCVHLWMDGCGCNRTNRRDDNDVELTSTNLIGDLEDDL